MKNPVDIFCTAKNGKKILRPKWKWVSKRWKQKGIEVRIMVFWSVPLHPRSLYVTRSLALPHWYPGLRRCPSIFTLLTGVVLKGSWVITRGIMRFYSDRLCFWLGNTSRNWLIGILLRGPEMWQTFEHARLWQTTTHSSWSTLWGKKCEEREQRRASDFQRKCSVKEVVESTGQCRANPRRKWSKVAVHEVERLHERSGSTPLCF